MTNEQQHVVWEGYGLRLHIPSNALPEGYSQFELKMKVALSKHFQLQAEDGFLVSAVYSFSHDLGDSEPITVEMQHCAATSVVKYLSIVRANDESPGDFKIMEGGVFDRTDGYGAIELHNFCRLAVYLKWRITSWLCVLKLRAAIYFTDIEYGSFQFHLYIVPDFSPLLRVRQICVQCIL